jgi:hypothetical protein
VFADPYLYELVFLFWNVELIPKRFPHISDSLRILEGLEGHVRVTSSPRQLEQLKRVRGNADGGDT